jgi:photosystem II stability/assembly factor-like uncharacterized protein
MRGRAGLVGFAAAFAIAGAIAAVVLLSVPGHAGKAAAASRPWPTRDLPGSVTLTGQVPLAIKSIPGAAAAQRPATKLGHHASSAQIGLSFGFPMRDKAGIEALIAQEARTHRYLTRAQLYARFSPPQAQVDALTSWLTSHGFRITHVGADRLAVTAYAPTALVEKTLHVRIDDFTHAASTFGKLKVPAYRFYANTTAPTVPARLGIQSIAGLSDVDRFYTSVQLGTGKLDPKSDCGDDDSAVINPLCVDVRSGGYFPTDLRSLYNITGHGFDGSGQTIGFTLWTAAERQSAMTQFATTTGDQLITIDPNCVATGNSPTVPSSCTTQTVAADHLLFILENGNQDNNFGSNVETALDVESAHGIATHVGMKYYAAECAANPPPGSGLANAGCNGSDVGLLETLEDAANDPTLHSVSNSWAFGGDAEWGAGDPFLVQSEPILAFGAAAGTTFYFSTGDSGTYQSGYPSDSPNVVAVGGTSRYSTSSPGTWSTSVTWSGGGSWCTNVFARPSWQTGAGVTANAPCPGRAIPDVSAVADPSTGVRFVSTRNADGSNPQSGQVGGTSLAAPVMNGLEAVTENFLRAQTYPGGTTPPIGFLAPMLYQLGNGGHSSSYYRDVRCGNTANPTSGPDGDAATAGWDAATGWGEPDWFNFSTGVGQALGATNLTTPPSLATHFAWTCAKTPSNSTERGFSFPSANVGYAVGSASGGTPWYGKFLPSGAWGAVNTFFKTTDGGLTWFPSNSDMFSIACTSGATCIEVGAGGRERRTADGGATWNDVATAPGNNKPLTQIACPSGSICYAVGDRGNAMKSTDGGQTWAWLASPDGNPFYGLSCPSTSTCYATDIYAHVLKTTDGGATWTWQSTPITTPGVGVPGSGGPNPFAGLMSISCSSVTTCAATGLYVVPSGAGQVLPSTDPPIITTTDGGATWTRQMSHAGFTGTTTPAPNYLHGISCLPGTTTCWAVGRNGAIVTTNDLATWTPQSSGTTNVLNSVLCLSTTFCVAVGAGGTVDVYNGSTWTATTGNGGTGMLADVDCSSNLVCYATGKQGITLLTTNGGTAWTIQAGGGTTQQMNGISCSSNSTCYAVGNAGTILKTSNGGQTWLPLTSGTTNALNGVACTSSTACVAVGAAGTARTTADGSTWGAGATNTTQALNGVACSVASTCAAVGATGTALKSSDGGSTWSASSSGVAVGLNAIACPSSTCYADGAVAAGSAELLKSTDGGGTWSPLTSGTANALSGIACASDTLCFADGAVGTIITTSDGTAWSQQGNPISGPVSALNATNIALNGAACTASRCVIGLGVQGDILTTGLLDVTLHATGVYGTTPNLSSISPGSSTIVFSPSGERSNVTGTLTCSTTAVQASPVGSYPVSSCSGLGDDNFTVVYNYAGSDYTVTKAPLTVTADDKSRLFGAPNPPLTATLSGFVLGQTLVTSGVTGSASCTTTAVVFSTAGNYPITCTVGSLTSGNYSFGPFVPGTLTVGYSSPCITTTRNGPFTVASGQVVCIGAGGRINGPLTVSAGGAIDVEGGTVTGPFRATGAGVVRLCGATITGPLDIEQSTGLVLVGGDAATGPCAGNTITGPVTLDSNTAGVEFNNNTVNGPATISSTTGTLPPPDTGSVHAEGNTVSGPFKIKP